MLRSCLMFCLQEHTAICIATDSSVQAGAKSGTPGPRLSNQHFYCRFTVNALHISTVALNAGGTLTCAAVPVVQDDGSTVTRNIALPRVCPDIVLHITGPKLITCAYCLTHSRQQARVHSTQYATQSTKHRDQPFAAVVFHYPAAVQA